VRGFVIAALLGGCGFSISVGDNTAPIDARDDASLDAEQVIDAEIDGSGLVCPAAFHAIGTGMYLVLSPTTHQNHMIACQSHGTHLAVIDDAQELAELVAYGKTVMGVMADSRFYIGMVQAPDQDDPVDGWIDFHDRDAMTAFWSINEPNDGNDNNETNHQEQVAAIRLDRGALVDLANTENVRAYCECDGIPIGPKAVGYLVAQGL
jgi:hypothetical protein